MVILSILEVVIILLLIFLRKRILIAIALIKEASRWVAGCPRGAGLAGPGAAQVLMPASYLLPRAVGYVMCSLLYPLVTFLLLCLCIAYWASTAVYPS